jgi:hypothetical protein
MNLTIKELLEKCNATEYSTKHNSEWKNKVSSDLNTIIANTHFGLLYGGADREILSANAAFRTIDRVAEFEGIQKTKPRRKKK